MDGRYCPCPRCIDLFCCQKFSQWCLYFRSAFILLDLEILENGLSLAYYNIIYNFNITYINRNDKLIRLIPFRRIRIKPNFVVDKQQKTFKLTHFWERILKFEFKLPHRFTIFRHRYAEQKLKKWQWSKMTMVGRQNDCQKVNFRHVPLSSNNEIFMMDSVRIKKWFQSSYTGYEYM